MKKMLVSRLVIYRIAKITPLLSVQRKSKNAGINAHSNYLNFLSYKKSLVDKI
jgi:hypothetical protein